MRKQKPLTDPDGEVRELTAADFKRMKRFSSLPAGLQAKLRKVGERGPQKTPTKERITIRLSRDVLSRFRDSGDGWQGRVDRALRERLKKHSPEA